MKARYQPTDKRASLEGISDRVAVTQASCKDAFCSMRAQGGKHFTDSMHVLDPQFTETVLHLSVVWECKACTQPSKLLEQLASQSPPTPPPSPPPPIPPKLNPPPPPSPPPSAPPSVPQLHLQHEASPPQRFDISPPRCVTLSPPLPEVAFKSTVLVELLSEGWGSGM